MANAGDGCSSVNMLPFADVWGLAAPLGSRRDGRDPLVVYGDLRGAWIFWLGLIEDLPAERASQKGTS